LSHGAWTDPGAILGGFGKEPADFFPLIDRPEYPRAALECACLWQDKGARAMLLGAAAPIGLGACAQDKN
jgi:hypothetical protein